MPDRHLLLDDGPEFEVTEDGDVIDPLELPDLTRPGAARAVRKLIEQLLAMTDDDDVAREHNPCGDRAGDSSAILADGSAP